MQKFRELFFPRETDDDFTSHTDTADNPSDPHSNGHSKPTGGDEGTGAEEAIPGEITNSGRSNGPNMVDNFRPVQPLHGRRVWRSFRLPGNSTISHSKCEDKMAAKPAEKANNKSLYYELQQP